jgi:hypothetical protein
MEQNDSFWSLREREREREREISQCSTQGPTIDNVSGEREFEPFLFA